MGLQLLTDGNHIYAKEEGISLTVSFELVLTQRIWQGIAKKTGCETTIFRRTTISRGVGGGDFTDHVAAKRLSRCNDRTGVKVGDSHQDLAEMKPFIEVGELGGA